MKCLTKESKHSKWPLNSYSSIKNISCLMNVEITIYIYIYMYIPEE